MPKISISVSEPTNSIQALKLIRVVTGGSVEGTLKKLARGRAGLFFSAQLFMNDHVEIAEKIRRLIHGLRDLKIEPFVIEIDDMMQWADVDSFDRYQVSADYLLNVLEEANGKFQ